MSKPGWLNRQNIGVLALLFMIISPILYWGSSSLPILIWDEAIYANNALEMVISGDFMVLQVNGNPDLYNTKPPFVIWCQSLCLQLFGANETAIRLPSLLSVLGVCSIIFCLVQKNFNSTRFALISILSLCTSFGYMRQHVALTGDLDSMLVFWITFFSFPILHYAINETSHTRKIILISGFGFLFAYLTKSTAALLPLPGIFLILLFSKKLKHILSDKVFYITAFTIVACIVDYYVLRESMLEGYWNHVYFSEFKRFTHNIMSWQQQPYDFYFQNLIKFGYFTPYVYIFPFCLLLGFLNPDKKIKKLTFYTTVFIFSYLSVISYPKVKLFWYDAPIYPFTSIIIGIGIHSLLNISLDRRLGKNKGFLYSIPQYLIIALLFIYPYYSILDKNNGTKPLYTEDYEGYTIKQIKKTHPSEKKYKVLMEYPAETPRSIDQGNFYIRSYNHFNHYQIELVMDLHNFREGDKVLVCQSGGKEFLFSNFGTEIIHENEFCSFIRIGLQK